MEKHPREQDKKAGSIWLKVLVVCNLLLLISVLVIGNMLMSTRRSLDDTDSWLWDVSSQLDEACARIDDGYCEDNGEGPISDQLSELTDRVDDLERYPWR